MPLPLRIFTLAADTRLSVPVRPSFFRAAHRFLQSVRVVEHLEMIAYHLKV